MPILPVLFWYADEITVDLFSEGRPNFHSHRHLTFWALGPWLQRPERNHGERPGNLQVLPCPHRAGCATKAFNDSRPGRFEHIARPALSPALLIRDERSYFGVSFITVPLLLLLPTFVQ